MDKASFLALAEKETRTEEEQKSCDQHITEFRDKYAALADEYGLDYSVKPVVEITLKK